MTNLTALPGLTTIWCDKPPTPPFHWRLANFGPVKVEVLFDSLGRQVFRDCAAVQGKTYPNKQWKSGGTR